MNEMDSKHAELEALLRMPEPPLADDGFSAAVLARLPAKTVRTRTARCLSLAVAGGIGTLVALLGVSPELLPLELLPVAITEAGAIVTSLTSAAAIALLMAPLAWLLYAEMTD